ncbi:hypothetical protein V1478_000565, partial [Vespula squamosa]
MYLRSHKGAAKGWYEQKREAVGGGGGLAKSRKNNNIKKSEKSERKNERRKSNSNNAIVVVVAIVVGGSIEDRRRRVDTSDQNDLFHGISFRSTDLELAKILLLRSRSPRGKITTSSSNREKISSRLVSDDSTKPLEFPKINVIQMVENGPPRRASRTSKRDPKMA